MAVQFNRIPQSGLRTPGYYGEINGAQTPYVSLQRLLLLGQKLADGSAASGVPVQVIGDPDGLFGKNSMMADEVKFARKNAPFQEIWALPMDDLAGGVKRVVTGTVAGGALPVENAASFSFWIGDVRIRTSVYTTDTATTLAARIAAAINAADRCPFTATSALGVITITARHKGTAPNSVVFDFDYYNDEGPLAATLLSFANTTPGSGDPDFTDALDDLADEPFRWIVGPYVDSTNLPAIQTFLNDVSGRWSPIQQNYGQYVGIDAGSISAQQTLAALYNEPTTASFGTYKCASPSWVIAGALGGRIAAHLSDAPELSRPLQTLELIGCLPPKLPADRPNITTRNTLYFAGVGSYRVQGRTMQIDRVVTHYRANPWGVADAVWLDLETRAQAMWSADGLRAAVLGQYGRAALMDDNPDNLPGVATPRDIRNVLIHEYKRQHSLGVVEHPELFSEALVVERSQQDATRVDCYIPEDVANQLRIVATNITIFLQRN